MLLIIYLIGFILLPIIMVILEKLFPTIIFESTESKDNILLGLFVIALCWPFTMFFILFLILAYIIRK